MCLGCLYFHIVVCSQVLNFLHNSFTKHLYQCFLAPSFFKLPSPTNYTSLRGPLHSTVLFCIVLFFTALYCKILFWHALKQIALYYIYYITEHCTILDCTLPYYFETFALHMLNFSHYPFWHFNINPIYITSFSEMLVGVISHSGASCPWTASKCRKHLSA